MSRSKERIFINPAHDSAEMRRMVRQFHPEAQIMGKCPRDATSRKPTTELTSIGEQYVIPGCEKHERPAGSQLKLWEGNQAMNRYYDTDFPDRPICAVLAQESDHALVIYEDEPDTEVATGNYPGRFLPAPAQ